MVRRQKFILRAAGTIVATVPPAAATLAYFPLWRARGGEYILSGLALTLLILSALPLRNTVKKYLRSPSVTLVWFLVFIAFFALSKIAEQVTVIAFFGLVGNLACTLLYKLAGMNDDRRDNAPRAESGGGKAAKGGVERSGENAEKAAESDGAAGQDIAEITQISGTPCTDSGGAGTGEKE